jgi:hypothetical protein
MALVGGDGNSMTKLIHGLLMGDIGGGLMSLRTMLSSRVVASTVVETVGAELASDNGGIGYFVRHCVHCGAYDMASYGGLLLFVVYLRYGWQNKEIARISAIDYDIGRLRQVTERLLWFVFLVFAKNVENAI